MGKFRLTASFAGLIFICISFFSVAESKEASAKAVYKEGGILVRFVSGTSYERKLEIRGKLGATLLKVIKSIDVEYWRLPEEFTTEEAMEFLKIFPEVKHVEPNYLYSPQNVPNDPRFGDLWYLYNLGQTVNGYAGAIGADIAAVEAWDYETGSKDVVIAVIDSGVAFDHPDLNPNIWTNPGEIPSNGIDDDKNGFIDDIHGWDFVNDDSNPSDYSRDLSGDGHGTHVAGIIAARGDNGAGVTGVMWKASIMALQIFDLFETNSFQSAIIQSINILSAIEYAVNNGARIINCSFGGPSPSQFLFDAYDFANQKGVLVVVAAGNEGTNNDAFPVYPANYDLPNIISVAATDERDQLADYSNYGVKSVDLAAPGGDSYFNILSTIPPKREVLFSEDFENGEGKWEKDGIFETWTLIFEPAFGSYVMEDSINNYHNNESSYIRLKDPINAENYRGLHIQMRAMYQLEENYDFFLVEGSNDGVNFSMDFPVTGSATGFSQGIEKLLNWGSDTEIGKFYLRFRLVSDSNNVFDGVYLDDIEITGIKWQFQGNEYGYKSGTSMAAPVVAGVAGLIWSLRPGLTHLEAKNIILNSVDKLDSLKGRVSTGGRVNALKALTGSTSDTGSGDIPADTEESGGGCFIKALGM